MTAVKFDVSQHEEVARYLGMSIDEVARRALLGSAVSVVQRISAVVIPAEPRPPVDRRIYAAGWRARPAPDGAIIQNTVPWSSIIEDGARAENIKVGRAMIDALAAWIKRKGLVKASGRSEKAKAEADAEARSMAWAVAMNMKKKGIFNGGKGLKILAKALKGLEKTFLEELRREIAREY